MTFKRKNGLLPECKGNSGVWLAKLRYTADSLTSCLTVVHGVSLQSHPSSRDALTTATKSAQLFTNPPCPISY